MSVNLRYSQDEKKTKHQGPLFGSIDFEVASSTKAVIESRGKSTTAGTLQIGGKEFKLTIGELEHLIETCQIARSAFFQKYRFGL